MEKSIDSRTARIRKIKDLSEILEFIREITELPLKLSQVDKKIRAFNKTPINKHPPQEPKFRITGRFFTMLWSLPSIELTVNDSRSKIRRECYGFRDTWSGERVYLRVEGSYILEFRDSPCGILLGKRYFLRGLILRNAEKGWKRVQNIMTREMWRQGAPIKPVDIKRYYNSIRPRVVAANRLVFLRERVPLFKKITRRRMPDAKTK